MPENNKGLAPLIRSVLSNPYSEQAIQQEILRLARENLYQPDILVALIDTLPQVKDTDIQRMLLDLLMGVDTSRFQDLEAFHSALIAAFKTEKEKRVRAILLERLAEALHQDTRLAPFFFDILADPALNDQELAAVTKAVSGLPSISEETAVMVLGRAQNAPTTIQEKAITLAESCPHWGAALFEAIKPYLDVKTDRGLRCRILERLAKSRSLTADYFPILRNILHADTDNGMRSMAMETLGSLKDWDGQVMAQLLWSSLYDADPALRARAVRMQKEAPDLTDDQLQEMAGRLTSDDAAGVRIQILGILKPRLSVPAVRAAILDSFGKNPSAFELPEFEAFVDLLSPYVSRDPGIRNVLLESWPKLPNMLQRKILLENILPKLKVDESTPWILRLFAQERNEEIRETLFERLKALSVMKNPDLVKVFCAELREPASLYRLRCAQSLAGAVEAYPEIPLAFEDVLLNDQERELVRTCLDGYLKPKVIRKFNVLLAVIGNEALDVTSRQLSLDRCVKDGLNPEQARQLSETLDASKSGLLRMPS